MIITSRQNERVKRVVSLKQKKYRDQYSLYIVEGDKMIADAINAGQQITEIFVSESYSGNGFKDIDNRTAVSDSVFSAMSDEVTPQGIIAVVKIPKSPPISRLSACLLLDRLQDPKNVGAILRLAAAAGVTDIIAVDCADAYSPKAVRASMSGLYRVNIYCMSEHDALKCVKNNGLKIIVADMDGKDIFKYSPPEKFCLAVGNEGKGVSDGIMSAADETVAIPMQNGVESLNVAMAAGITLYTLLNGKSR